MKTVVRAYWHRTATTENEYRFSALATVLLRLISADKTPSDGTCLAVSKTAMKNQQDITTRLFLLACGIVLSVFTAASVSASTPQSAATAEVKLTPQEKQLVANFNRRVKDYLKQRSAAKKKLTPLSKEATPQQIEAYQQAFVAALRSIRAGTQPGYIFIPEFTQYVRTIIQTEFPARDKAEIKQTILEAETKGVPLKVNYPYPETKELTEMPPTLLLKLPQLPSEVKYRFVGRHLLLVDSDNSLIVDYTLNALP